MRLTLKVNFYFAMLSEMVNLHVSRGGLSPLVHPALQIITVMSVSYRILQPKN